MDFFLTFLSPLRNEAFGMYDAVGAYRAHSYRRCMESRYQQDN